MIKLSIISITSRSISFEIENDKYFYTENNINIYLNNDKIDEINTNVFTIKNLNPMSEYSILLEDSKTKETSEKIIVRTKDETSLINVKNVGAKGNGKVIDTAYIQAAIEICPKNGRIFFPKGKYLTGPIFLKVI